MLSLTFDGITIDTLTKNNTAKSDFSNRVASGVCSKLGIAVSKCVVASLSAGSVVASVNVDTTGLSNADAALSNVVSAINSDFASVFPGMKQAYGVTGVSAKVVTGTGQTAPTPTPTPTPAPNGDYTTDSGSSGMSKSAKIGVGVGVGVGVPVVAGVVVGAVLWKRKQQSSVVPQQPSAVAEGVEREQEEEARHHAREPRAPRVPAAFAPASPSSARIASISTAVRASPSMGEDGNGDGQTIEMRFAGSATRAGSRRHNY